MLVSHDRKFVFIHVPRTGGTSVTQALGGFASTILPAMERHTHWTVLDAWQHLGYESFTSYYKFGFVRNPWDWMLSLFCYIQSNKDHENHHRVHGMTFDQFVEWWATVKRLGQLNWLANSRGKLMVDFVGRFENLQGDFDRACQGFGQASIALPALNQTKHARYAGQYSTKSKSAVAALCAAEIEQFNYTFA